MQIGYMQIVLRYQRQDLIDLIDGDAELALS